MSEDPFDEEIGEESDKCKKHGGKPVDILYILEGARLTLEANEAPSHTALTELGLRAGSRLFMDELVHS